MSSSRPVSSEPNYWQRRTSRRTALRRGAASVAGVTALATVGCGGDDDPEDGGGDVLGRSTPTVAGASTPVDPFTGAVKGGTLKTSITGDPPVLDPYRNPATNTKLFSSYVYSRLFKYKTGPGKSSQEADLTGDLAASAESSPDGLEWVVKLKPNATFHDVAPVNGRKVTSADVKFSWDRATGEAGINRALLAFISKAEFPDAETVKFTLAEPNAAFLDVLADVNLIWVQPAEAGSSFDPAKTAIGSGPWKLKDYQPSTKLSFQRNPSWYEAGFPLLDEVEVSIIPEYANSRAQFQAGSLDTFAPTSNDVVDLKQQLPDIQILSNTYVSMYQFYFDKDPSAPWRQERVRQAMSMALDRDGLNDLAYNITNLKKAGVNFTVPFNNIVPVGFGAPWLDPVSEKAGASRRTFSYDPDAAKRLLAEAGFPDGFTATYQYTANAYGTLHNTIAEASQQMLAAIGIKTTTDVQDYASKYYSQTYRGDFKGIAFGPESSFNEPGSYPLRLFTPNPLNKGGDSDEQLKKLAFDQQRELNPERRIEILHEIQRIHGERLYVVPSPFGAGPTWTALSPKLRNADNFSPRISYVAGGEAYPYYWKLS